MATLKGQTVAASYQDLLKRADTYSQTGTNVELMDDSAVVKPTGLYLESGATTDNVGIGVASPTEMLHIESSVVGKPILLLNNTNADANSSVIQFTKTSDSQADNDNLGMIDFVGKRDTGALVSFARIVGFSQDITIGDDGGELRFQVAIDNTAAQFLSLQGYKDGTGAQAVGGGSIIFNEDSKDIDFRVESDNNANAFFIQGSSGNVGIGTAVPGNPLAVNRSGDGVIVDFESADAVEGTVSISGATTSYNAFVGSHYTQLKDGQNDLPVGAVVSTTGEIITCNLVTEAIAGVDSVEAKDAVYETVTKQRQKVIVTEIEEEQTSTEIVEEGGKYVQKTTTETVTKEVSTPQYEEVKLYDEDGKEIGTHQIQVMEDYEEEQLVSEAVEAVEAVEAIEATTTNSPNKEYFTYVNTTTTASDPTVYGTWMGKMSDDAKGHSFGDDDKPIYLVAQVGLFKIRVTDTNGNIAKGDYLESSTRAMEGQKQTSNARINSTIGKAMIDVDWASVETDSDLSYKWKLIPCIF